MNRRIPLWLTLIPLIAAIAIYWLFWSGWARDFKAAVAAWLPASELAVSGFPYRLELDVANPRLVTGDVVRITATASRAQINRGPWQPQLTIVNAENPRFAAIVGPAIAVSISGKSAASSIKILDGRLARLSSVIAAASLRTGFTPMPVTADALEIHLRERIPTAAAADSGPTEAPRGQLVITGERLRLGGGDALSMAADITANGAARLLSYDNWATTGTLELTSLTLGDAHGEVARIRATLVPRARTGLRFAGTIETICPASIAAALDRRPAPSEKRLRAPVLLSFEGMTGEIRLTGAPTDLATRPVRGQLPPCPVLRGAG